jgi:hypothetical protein
MTTVKAIEAEPWARFSGINALASADLQDGRFSVMLEGGRFECFLQQKSEASHLFVLLSGARNPETQPLPKFDRWSWSKRFPGHVLCVSDPTLYLDEAHMGIGWYVGPENKNWPLRLSGLVRAVATQLAVPTRRVVCYGSSAGGFASMMLAAQLGDATAVAINPQTDVLKYSKRFVQHLLKVCFNGREPGALNAAARARLSATDAFRRRPAARCLIAQNLEDPAHLLNHYGPFCESLGAPIEGGSDPTGRVQSMTFSDPMGHGPEPRHLVDELIARGVALCDRPLDRTVAAPAPAPACSPPIAAAAAERPRMRAKQVYLLRNKLQKLDAKAIDFFPPGRQDLQPLRLQLPLDWNADPFTDRNWCGQLHMWRMMDNHLLEFDRTSDRSWLQLPIRLMLDWHRFHLVENKPSTFSWMDMMVGLRAMKLAFVLSAHQADRTLLSAREVSAFMDMVDAHLAFLLDPSKVSYSNHTFIDMHGLAALESVMEDDSRSQPIRSFLSEVMPRLIGMQFNKYGVHLENSPGYQKFGIGCLLRLEASGWFKAFGVERIISKAREVDDWFRLPDGRCVPVGDTDGEAMPSQPRLVIRATNELINNSGYVIYRDDGGQRYESSSYLFVMAAFTSRFHKQSDDLSFVWFEGEDILCDTGKFAYKASEIRGYAQSTRAHNTVEIDRESSGQNFSAHPNMVYGSAVRQASVHEWGVLVSTEVLQPKSKVRHRRHILYRPKHWVLVLDQLSGHREHHFTQWFHLSPHLSCEVAGSGRVTTALRSGRTLSITACGSRPVATNRIRGQLKPVRQGWISQAYGTIKENDALGFSQEGRDVVFATLLCIGGHGSRVSLRGNIVEMEVAAEHDTDRLTIELTDAVCRVTSVDAA